MNAYKTAQDPDQWEAENAENQDRMRAADDGADQLDDSEDEVETGGKTGGKRKRKSDAKAQNEGDKKKAKGGNAKAKGKAADKSKGKSKDSEDKSEGMLKTKEWRNKLQKAFLQGSLPTSAQAVEFDKVFTDMETFDHKQEWLVPTKLPKVVKKIAAIKDEIPGDAEYKFKTRSLALIDQWKDALFGKEENGEEKKESDPAAATNGDQKAEEAAATNGDAPAAEPVVEQEAAEDVKMEESKTDEPVKDAPAEDAAAAEPKPAEDPDASATQ